MKIKMLPSRLPLFLLLSFSVSLSMAQENKNNPSVAGSSTLAATDITSDAYANIFIYYPIAKSGNGYSIFLNRMNIGKLPNGGRMECRLLHEKPVAVTVIEGPKYVEPFTQSGNSRTISVKKGKSYYFRVNGSGGLEYIFDAARGQKNFSDSKDFVSQPVSFVETAVTSVPVLTAATN